MENEKNAVFRNAFGGYNKNDVNEYLASMAKEFARREDEWDTERGKLERMSQDERTEKEQIAAQRDELACQLYSVQADVQQKTGELERECQITTELKASVAGLSERIHQLECELAKKMRNLLPLKRLWAYRKRNVRRGMTCVTDSVKRSKKL